MEEGNLDGQFVLLLWPGEDNSWLNECKGPIDCVKLIVRNSLMMINFSSLALLHSNFQKRIHHQRSSAFAVEFSGEKMDEMKK